MAEFAAREALATAEKVIIGLSKLFKCPTMLHADVERAQKCLKMIHACLIDSGDIIDEESDSIRNCIRLAYSIENILDEFLLQLLSDDVQTNKTFHGTDDEVPEAVQTNRSSHSSYDQVSDEVQTNEESYQNSDDEDAKFIGDWEAGDEFSTNINKILDDNIDFVRNLLDSLQKDISKGRSRSRLGDGLTWSYGDLATDDDVLGFEEHKEKLLTELVVEDLKLSTFLIVGPGGSGKSTLVKIVFENDRVQRSFDFKRWVPVPRGSFQLNELLLKMLPADSENIPAASEDTINPKAKLRHFLQDRRYMIVLDDVWRSEDLQCILKVLPDGLPGSRIIITTRNSDVAFFLSPKYSHDLSSGLSSGKAKDLLFKKALHKGKGLFVTESDKILRWCGCLPYAVSEVGRLLASMKPQTAQEWMVFQSHSRSAVRPGSSLSIISSVLQPSYVDLPNHLKTCFLYLSAFPDDHCIEPERLIHLWVAEGFVKPKRGMTEEQVAEEYLNELIARSLVIATEREINGRVRSCSVVSHVRDFLLSKPENFFTVFGTNNSTDGTPGEQIRRLSIHQSDISLLGSLIARDDLKHIRTLLVFTKSECCFINDLDKLVMANKYVRVLDLSEVVFESGDALLKNVVDSILLKYLSLQGCKVYNIPESIRKLQFLETLNLQSTKVTELPKEICLLSSLRHLLVSGSSGRGVKLITVPNIGVLSSIQSLSLVDVGNDTITVKGLAEWQELRKLRLVGLETKDGKELCSGLEKMKHLSTLDVTTNYDFAILDLDYISSPLLYLQHLRLKGCLKGLPKWISKLTSLQKVELIWSVLDSNPTELLQDLPNLIELHLVGFYKGEELVFRAETFKKLMKLSIVECSCLNMMEVADGSLPMLRELKMSKCPNLKTLPRGIDGLQSLYKLVVENMPHEFVAKLRKGSEYHQVVRHIPVILCPDSDALIEELSENVSSTSNIQGHDGKQVKKPWFRKLQAKLMNLGRKKGSEKGKAVEGKEQKGKAVIEL